MTKRLPVFAFLFLLTLSSLHASTPRDPYEYFFQQSLGDLTEELEIARDEGKHAVLGG